MLIADVVFLIAVFVWTMSFWGCVFALVAKRSTWAALINSLSSTVIAWYLFAALVF